MCRAIGRSPGIGDFNGDGVPDILWRDTSAGTVAIWFLNSSGTVQSTASVGVVPTGTTWTIVETGDFNGDGMSDILWIDGSGNVAIWFMNGATVASTAGLGSVGTTLAGPIAQRRVTHPSGAAPLRCCSPSPGRRPLLFEADDRSPPVAL